MPKTFLTLTLVCFISSIRGMQPLVPTTPTLVPTTPIALTHISAAPGITPVIIVTRTGIRYPYLKSEKSEPTFDLRAYPRTCPKKKEINRLVNAAIETQNPHAIREYFSNWHGDFTPFVYAQEMAQALIALAHKPHSNITSSSIAYLLGELYPEHIRLLNEPMDCVLDAAMDNGHLGLIRFIDQAFTFPFAQWALFDAIESNNPKRVEALLKAGISPDKGLGTQDREQDIVHDGGPRFKAYPSRYAHYPLHLAVQKGFRKIVILLLKYGANNQRLDHNGHQPLDTATFGLLAKSTSQDVQNRFAIIKRLLENLPPEKRPLGFALKGCHMPKKTRAQLRDLFNSYHIPGRLCMTDDAESAPTLKETAIEPCTINTTLLKTTASTCAGALSCCTTTLFCLYKKLFHTQKPKTQEVVNIRKNPLRRYKRN